MDKNCQTDQIADRNYNPIPEQCFAYNLDSAIFNEQLVDNNYGNEDNRVSHEWNRENAACTFNLEDQRNFLPGNAINLNEDFRDISDSGDHFQYYFNEISAHAAPYPYLYEGEALNTLTREEDASNHVNQPQPFDENLSNSEMVMTSMDGEIYAVLSSGEMNTENPATLSTHNGNEEIVINSYNMQSSKEMKMVETLGNDLLSIENIWEDTKLVTVLNDKHQQQQEEQPGPMDSEMLVYSAGNGKVVLYSHPSNDAGNSKNNITASSSERLEQQAEDCKMLSIITGNNHFGEPCLYISQDNPDGQVYIYSTGGNDTSQDAIINSDGIFGDDTKVALMDVEGNIVGFLNAECDHELHARVSASNIVSECIDLITKPLQENQNNECNDFQLDLVTKNNPFGQVNQSLLPKSKMESIQLKTNLLNISRNEKPNCSSADVRSKTISKYEHNQSPNILLLHPLRTRKSTARKSRMEKPIKPNGFTVAKEKLFTDSYLKQFDKNSIKVSLFNDLSSVCTSDGKTRTRKSNVPHLKDTKCYFVNSGQDQLQKLPKTEFSSKSYLERYTINANIPEINEIFSRKRKNNSSNGNQKLNGKADSGFQQIGSNQERINSNIVSPQSSEYEDPDIKKNQFKCRICSKIFKSTRSLSIHQNTCKSMATKVYRCVPKELKPIGNTSCSEEINTMVVITRKSNDAEDFPTVKKRKLVTRFHSKLENTKCDSRNEARDDDKTP